MNSEDIVLSASSFKLASDDIDNGRNGTWSGLKKNEIHHENELLPEHFDGLFGADSSTKLSLAQRVLALWILIAVMFVSLGVLLMFLEDDSKSRYMGLSVLPVSLVVLIYGLSTFKVSIKRIPELKRKHCRHFTCAILLVLFVILGTSSIMVLHFFYEDPSVVTPTPDQPSPSPSPSPTPLVPSTKCKLTITGLPALIFEPMGVAVDEARGVMWMHSDKLISKVNLTSRRVIETQTITEFSIQALHALNGSELFLLTKSPKQRLVRYDFISRNSLSEYSLENISEKDLTGVTLHPGYFYNDPTVHKQSVENGTLLFASKGLIISGIITNSSEVLTLGTLSLPRSLSSTELRSLSSSRSYLSVLLPDEGLLYTRQLDSSGEKIFTLPGTNTWSCAAHSSTGIFLLSARSLQLWRFDFDYSKGFSPCR